MAILAFWSVCSAVDDEEIGSLLGDEWEPFAACPEGPGKYRIFLKRLVMAEDNVPRANTGDDGGAALRQSCATCQHVGELRVEDLDSGIRVGNCKKHKSVVQADVYCCEDYDPQEGA